MHRRYEHSNIPIEIIRTFVSVVETGSFSKAGQALGLSQPAITAQMKRLQTMVGGAMFEHSGGGTGLTARGLLALIHAKRILEENDQLLSLGGATSDSRPIRVGLPTVFADDFFKVLAHETGYEQLTFISAHTMELEKNFADGYLDIACVLHPPEDLRGATCEWMEPFVWVRSPRFVLSPGRPIPVISWPGSPQAQPAVTALENSGSAYRLVFSSYDYRARMGAAAAGLGLMSMPERQVKPPLAIAKEYYLPELPPLCVGLRVRKALPAGKTGKVIELLKKLRPETAEKNRDAASESSSSQPVISPRQI